jgi:site-specific DNA-methyltransferase (adenine-specific)
MKPYYDQDGITIYHGDCREIVPQLGRFDLLLTDPPYGIGEKMKGGTWGMSQKYEKMRKWDTLPDPSFLQSITALAAHSIIWGGNYFPLPPSRCWLVWDKRNAVPTVADCELAWTNIDKPAKRFSWNVGCHDLGHPTQKPLELFSWCLGQVADTKTILDCYAGSGTTGRAAKDLGLKATLIEREEAYCEIAARRMSQQVLGL